jgi:hypothetical protein
VVLRLVVGILAVTFLPIGLTFTIIGLVVDEPDRGRPEAFLYTGIALGLVGAGFALAFVVLWRREAERRRRRREGLRTTAEVVRAKLNPNVRTGSSMAMNLTVRFPSAGTPDGTVRRTLFVEPSSRLTEGARIEIVYDPADPSNFEPAPQNVP